MSDSTSSGANRIHLYGVSKEGGYQDTIETRTDYYLETSSGAVTLIEEHDYNDMRSRDHRTRTTRFEIKVEKLAALIQQHGTKLPPA